MRFFLYCLLLVWLGAQLRIAFANPGDVDLSFARSGKVRVGFNRGQAECYAATVQADGKLILAGGSPEAPPSPSEMIVARFDTNGLPDASFGDGGRVVAPLASSRAYALAVKVQDDGKIVVGGYSYERTNDYVDAALVRYNSDGSPDSTFGTNDTGVALTDSGAHRDSLIEAMAIQPDGKIVVFGEFPTTPGYLGLARYDTNGVLDPTFGNGGIASTPGLDYIPKDIMLQPDGKIVAISDHTIFRFNTNGVLDTTFGGTGQVSTGWGYYSSAAAVAYQFGNNTIQDPSKILVAGTVMDFTGAKSYYYSVVTRINLDGSLDTSFGHGGTATNALVPQILSGEYSFNQYCTGLVVQRNFFLGRAYAKVIVGGYGDDGTNYDFALARLNADGSLDATFGPNASGKVIFPVSYDFTRLEARTATVVLQSGNFVLAGDRGAKTGEIDFAAARFTSSGIVDTGFGTDGFVTADVSDARAQANAVAIQPDGKVVVAGTTGSTSPSYEITARRFALARFNPDGSRDSTFGLNGKVTTLIATNDRAYAVAIQPDGKVLAAGSSYLSGNSEFGLVRYNPDGTLDSSFGSNGVATLLVGTGDDQASAVQIQPDGKIIAAGQADDPSGFEHFALVRFNGDGTLDTTFGTAGKVITSFGATSRDEGYAAGIQPDGDIVLAGLTFTTNGSSVTADLAAARYGTNGAPDFSFGLLGRTTANVGGGTEDAGYAMAIQPDGKIIVAGGAGFENIPGPINDNTNADSFVVLARFTASGELDPSFGNNGTVIAAVGPYSDYATALALQPDGKILVAGASQQQHYLFFVERYNPDGSLDSSYANHGSALVNFGTGTNEIAYALALDSSDRAVIVGDAGGLFGVTRLEGDFAAVPRLQISLTSSNTVVISWPYPSTRWNLQQNADLSATNWVTSPETIQNNGTKNFTIVDPSSGARFYRLNKP